jgi:hypothetical protein
LDISTGYQGEHPVYLIADIVEPQYQIEHVLSEDSIIEKNFVLSEVWYSNRWYSNEYDAGNAWDEYTGIGVQDIYNSEFDEVVNYDMLPRSELMIYDLGIPDTNYTVEDWSDTIEVYNSSTPDEIVYVDEVGIARFNLRWASNDTVITEGIIWVQVSGDSVNEFVQATFTGIWWSVEYVHTEVAVLNFTVYSVDCYGMTEFEVLSDPVHIFWNQSNIVTASTSSISTNSTPTSGTTITYTGTTTTSETMITDTSTITTTTPQGTATSNELVMTIIIMGSIGGIVVVILIAIKSKRS